jgi:hypothetical protein
LNLSGLLTFERLIRTIISILIRMRQQTQFPVSLFNFCLGALLLHTFQTEYVIVGRVGASPDAYDGGFLLDGECPAGAAIVMGAVFGIAVGPTGVGTTGFGGHGRLWEWEWVVCGEITGGLLRN